MKFVGTALVLFAISAVIYDKTGSQLIVYGGCLGMLIVVLALAVKALPKKGDRRKAVRSERRDYDPSLPDLKEIEALERDVFNDNYRSIAVWSGSQTYIDFDGVIRDTGTDEVKGFAYRRKK